jgi:hypothetical protein
MTRAEHRRAELLIKLGLYLAPIKNVFGILRDFWRLFSLVTALLSISSITLEYLHAPINVIFKRVVDSYHAVLRDPLVALLGLVGLHMPPVAADIFIAYMAFGGLFSRSIRFVVDLDQGVPIKGAWGRISYNAITKHIPYQSKLGAWAFHVLAVLFWPAVGYEYFFKNRYVFLRYMDDAHSPRRNARIGFATAQTKNVQGIQGRRWANYSPSIDYDLDTDTWYEYSADLRKIFYVNLCVFSVALVLFLGFGAVPWAVLLDK